MEFEVMKNMERRLMRTTADCRVHYDYAEERRRGRKFDEKYTVGIEIGTVR